jgi:spermidine synthase
VIEKPSGRRILHLNEGLAVHSVLSPHGVFTGGYWDFMTVLPTLNTVEGDELRVLILGLAGGSMALQLEHFYLDSRDLKIDGVEIDPGVIEAGRKFFKLDEITSLKVHIADARTYLLRAEPGYDLIIADAYRNPYIPFHMVTREFYAQCLGLLKEDGIFAINLATSPHSDELVDSFTVTMGKVFPHVGLCTTEEASADFQNFIFTGSNNKLDLRQARNIPRLLKMVVYPRMLHTWNIPEAGDKGVVFTDDCSPIEYFTERSILKAVFDKVGS